MPPFQHAVYVPVADLCSVRVEVKQNSGVSVVFRAEGELAEDRVKAAMRAAGRRLLEEAGPVPEPSPFRRQPRDDQERRVLDETARREAEGCTCPVHYFWPDCGACAPSASCPVHTPSPFLRGTAPPRAIPEIMEHRAGLRRALRDVLARSPGMDGDEVAERLRVRLAETSLELEEAERLLAEGS